MDISKITLVFRQDDDGQAFVRVLVYASDGQVADQETSLDTPAVTFKFDDRTEVEA